MSMTSLKKKIGSVVNKVKVAVSRGSAPLGKNNLKVFRKWENDFLVPAKAEASEFRSALNNIKCIVIGKKSAISHIEPAIGSLIEVVDGLNKDSTFKDAKERLGDALNEINALPKDHLNIPKDGFASSIISLKKTIVAPAKEFFDRVEEYFGSFVYITDRIFGKNSGIKNIPSNVSGSLINKFNIEFDNFKKGVGKWAQDRFDKNCYNICINKLGCSEFMKKKALTNSAIDIRKLMLAKEEFKRIINSISMYITEYVKSIQAIKDNSLKQIQEIFKNFDKMEEMNNKVKAKAEKKKNKARAKMEREKSRQENAKRKKRRIAARKLNLQAETIAGEARAVVKEKESLNKVKNKVAWGENNVRVLQEWRDDFLNPVKSRIEGFCKNVRQDPHFRIGEGAEILRMEPAVESLISAIGKLEKDITPQDAKKVLGEGLEQVYEFSKDLSKSSEKNFANMISDLNVIITVPALNFLNKVKEFLNPFIEIFKNYSERLATQHSFFEDEFAIEFYQCRVSKGEKLYDNLKRLHYGLLLDTIDKFWKLWEVKVTNMKDGLADNFPNDFHPSNLETTKNACENVINKINAYIHEYTKAIPYVKTERIQEVLKTLDNTE